LVVMTTRITVYVWAVSIQPDTLS